MTNQSLPQNPKEHLQQMNILYLSLLAGQLMIVAILYFFVENTTSGEEGEVMATSGGIDPMVIVGCLAFVASVSASFFIFNKKAAEGAQLSGTLMEKLNHYRASFLLRAAMLEGPNLLMILLYFFASQHIVFMVLFAIGIGLFLLIRPTADRIIQDYNLSASEQNELRNHGN